MKWSGFKRRGRRRKVIDDSLNFRAPVKVEDGRTLYINERGATSYARRPRDLDRMAWIRTQACALLGAPLSTWVGPRPDACKRHVEAHHAGTHGVAQKSPDEETVPLCDHHHDDLTDVRGVFAGWAPGALREWQNAAIAFYQARYDTYRIAMQTFAF